jgi:hypothetical protein
LNQVKARELNKEIFKTPSNLLLERKSCPPMGPQFNEFRLKTLERGDRKPVEVEKAPEFKARPMPVFREPNSPQKSVASSNFTDFCEFKFKTDERMAKFTERLSAPPMTSEQLSIMFKAAHMPDFKKVSLLRESYIFSCTKSSK